MDTMLKVSTTEIEFELQPDDERSFYKLELQNVNPTKNIGFKIKSTNVERYVVSPTADVIEPSQKINIDIVLHLKKSDLDFNKIGDKFAVFFMEVEDGIGKDQVEKYLKQNSKQQSKIYIKIKILRHSEQTGTILSQKQSVSTSMPVEPINVERKQNMYTSEDSSYLKFQNDIYEKEQFIQKLKKEKKELEQNLQKIQQIIKDQKSFQNAQKPKQVQNFVLFIIFFIGIVIGALFNSY